MSTLASPDSGHLLLMIRDLFDNAALWWGLAACGVAQLSKLVVELVWRAAGIRGCCWKPAGCPPVTQP